MTPYDTFTSERDGVTFETSLYCDHDYDRPWEEFDGSFANGNMFDAIVEVATDRRTTTVLFRGYEAGLLIYDKYGHDDMVRAASINAWKGD